MPIVLNSPDWSIQRKPLSRGSRSAPGPLSDFPSQFLTDDSEVADELEVPQHVLRFWETKFAQIRPLKRGGGRRYYRPEDIDLLRAIRDLLYEQGYTIKGVQKLMREGGLKIGEEGLVETPAEAEATGGEPGTVSRASVSQTILPVALSSASSRHCCGSLSLTESMLP